MSGRLLFALTAAGTIALAGGASTFAATTTYDDSLVAPGFYNGTGNPNGGFTIVNDNNIELGLRAKLRQANAVIHSPTDLYLVPVGPQPGNPARAAWNYDFSINLRAGGGSLTLNDINAKLIIANVTLGQSATVDPLDHWTDNSGWGGVKHSPALLTDWGAQNSQNATFGDFPLAAYYNMNAPNQLYTMTLEIWDSSNTNLLASDSINIQVVPEPASLGILGVSAVGLLMRRRRQTA